VYSMSFIVWVVLYVVFRLRVVCYFLWCLICVVSYCSTTPTGENLICS
jgi:hypothetical protein